MKKNHLILSLCLSIHVSALIPIQPLPDTRQPSSFKEPTLVEQAQAFLDYISLGNSMHPLNEEICSAIQEVSDAMDQVGNVALQKEFVAKLHKLLREEEVENRYTSHQVKQTLLTWLAAKLLRFK